MRRLEGGRTMMLRRSVSIGLAVIYAFSIASAAGAATVAPTGPLAPGPTGLAPVIEGAKKEGVLSAKLVPALTEKSMYRLEREIRQKFGVDLKIKFTPVENMPKDVSEAI